jgi:hypothetical protein
MGTLLVCVAALLPDGQARDGGERRMKAPAGSVVLPETWQRTGEARSLHVGALQGRAARFRRADGASGIRLARLQSPAAKPGREEVEGLLRRLAAEKGLPTAVRPVAGELLERARARHGGFVLGTLPPAQPAARQWSGGEEILDFPKEELLDSLHQASLRESMDAELDSLYEQPEGSRSVYWMVAVYGDGEFLYLYEGWTGDPLGASLELAAAQRTWRVFENTRD